MMAYIIGTYMRHRFLLVMVDQFNRIPDPVHFHFPGYPQFPTYSPMPESVLCLVVAVHCM